jgi:hypothetical protein
MNNNTKYRFKRLSKKDRQASAMRGLVRKSKHAKVARSAS